MTVRFDSRQIPCLHGAMCLVEPKPIITASPAVRVPVCLGNPRRVRRSLGTIDGILVDKSWKTFTKFGD